MSFSLILLVWTLGFGVVSADGGEDDPFPYYDVIQDNVEFWRDAYATWSRGQVAVHDVQHLGLVYEVADLPGEVTERYTRAQRDFVDDLKRSWQEKLRKIEHKLDRRLSLSRQEKQLVLRLTEVGGSDAIRDARKRVRVQRGLRERFRRGLEISARYDDLFRRIFANHGVPEDLAFLPHVESSFQAHARSSAGAVGIWQFTRGTGRRYLYVTTSMDERLDPVSAARGAARYMRDAYARIGDWPLALTAYNHGIEGMYRASQAHGGDYEDVFLNYNGRLFGFASRNFYAEFLAAREIARDPERFFPEGFTPEDPIDLDRVVIEHRVTAQGISKAYDVEIDTLANLNPAWTERAVKHGLSLPKEIEVWLPRGTLFALEQSGTEPDLASQVPPDATHVVRRGETLTAIADRYAMSLEDLREMNGLSGSLIHSGQRLKVPGNAGGVHVVRRGETLSSIASHYGMSLASLRSMNGMPRNSSLIHPGQELQVAGGASRTHVVRRGETLSRIASQYRVKLADLLHLNALNLASLIHPGQVLQIP